MCTVLSAGFVDLLAMASNLIDRVRVELPSAHPCVRSKQLERMSHKIGLEGRKARAVGRETQIN